MYIKVDEQQQTEIEGFQYTNKNGLDELVKLEQNWVSFQGSSGVEISEVYYEDIPNFIKALEAAYEHKIKGTSNVYG